MKYTKEDIERIKTNPLIRAFSILGGFEIDDLIKQIESEYEGDGELEWNPDKGTSQKLPAENKKTSDENKRTKCPFPFSKETVSSIINECNRYVNFLEAGNLNAHSVPFDFFQLFRMILGLQIGSKCTYYLTETARFVEDINEIMSTLNKLYYEQ